MSEIRQGEIRPLLFDGKDTGTREVVVSNDAVNAEAVPLVVPIIRGRYDNPPLLIELAEQDPHAGTANVSLLTSVAFDGWSLGEPVGLVTGATLDRILNAVRELIAP